MSYVYNSWVLTKMHIRLYCRNYILRLNFWISITFLISFFYTSLLTDKNATDFCALIFFFFLVCYLKVESLLFLRVFRGVFPVFGESSSVLESYYQVIIEFLFVVIFVIGSRMEVLRAYIWLCLRVTPGNAASICIARD